MANLISRASGNLTDAATWGVADTTSAQTSITSWVANWDGGPRISQNFTPGAITVDGVVLFIQPGNGNGNVIVTLYNATDAVAVATVTVAASALNEDYGPRVFAFAAVTLVAGKAYNVRVQASAGCSNNTNWGRDNTGDNLWRLLRTTTTQAPADNDALWIQGDHTAVGSMSTTAVTMNNTADLTVGTANNASGVFISKGGTLEYGYAASTAYVLKVKGFIEFRAGGVITLGTAAHPIPATSTAKLLFTHTASDQGGFNICNGELTTYGATKTLHTKLTATAAAAQAVINVVDVTGWAAGDVVAISPHRSVAADWDEKIIDSISTLAVTLTTNLGTTHEGTGIPVVGACYVLNLTQNVVIGSSNTTYRFKLAPNAKVKYLMRYTQIMAISNEGWGGGLFLVRGASNASTMDVQYCTFSNNCRAGSRSDMGTNDPTTLPATMKFSNNVGYQLEECMFGFTNVSGNACATLVYECKNNVVGRSTYHNDNTFNIHLCKGVVTGNVVLCYQDYQNTFAIAPGGYLTQEGTFVFEDNICFGTGSTTLYLSGGPNYFTEWRFSRIKQTRCGSSANFFEIGSGHAGLCRLVDCEMRSGQFFVRFNNDTRHGVLCVDGGVVGGESATYPVSQTVFMTGSQMPMRLECCGVDFTAGTGIVEFFTNSYVPWIIGDLVFTDCKIPTARVDDTALGLLVVRMFTFPQNQMSAICFHNTNQVADDHRFVIPFCGFGKRDDTIYHTAAPSEKLYPKSATYKMRSSVKRFTVNVGESRTVLVYVRKAAAYNGAVDPRLIVGANVALGYKFPTTVSTFAASADTWAMLSATLPVAVFKTVVECYIEIEGTAGYVNVDDWGFV